MLFKILLVFKRYQPKVTLLDDALALGFCCEILPYPKLGHPATLLQASVIRHMDPLLIRIARATNKRFSIATRSRGSLSTRPQGAPASGDC